jgi:hypothetical protein
LKYSRGMFCLLFNPRIKKRSKPVIHRSHRLRRLKKDGDVNIRRDGAPRPTSE